MEHLIDPQWFESLAANYGIWTLFLIGLGSMYLLLMGADWLVGGATGVAHRMGMPKIIIGATIMSLGTTTPEAAVSVFAAWGGNAGLALGNAVGSVIADTGLIFGLGCMLAALPADKYVLNRQGLVQLGSALLLAAISYGVWFAMGEAAELQRWVGILFCALLVWYLWVSVKWGRAHVAATKVEEEEADILIEKAAKDSWTKLGNLMVIGLVFTLVFAHILIICVSIVAESMGVPQVVIASTIVAFGTSLPELIVGIQSIRRGHPELLVGNVIGADVLNILFVTGAAAVAKPLPVVDAGAPIPEVFLYLHLPAMLLLLIWMRVMILSASKRGRFVRWQGAPLVAGYVVYLVLNYVLGVSGGG